MISQSDRLWRSGQTSWDSSELTLIQIQELIDTPRRLPSGESVLSGRPDPSEVKPGAKLPPAIEEIDHLLKKSDEDPRQVHPRRNLHHLLTQHRLSSENPTTSDSKPKPRSFTVEAAEGQHKNVDQQEPK